MEDAFGELAAVDDILALRRAQGTVRTIKTMLRDIGAEAKDAP